jgi:hypothetical protein
MRFPRMTMRRWMVVVAVSALEFGVIDLFVRLDARWGMRHDPTAFDWLMTAAQVCWLQALLIGFPYLWVRASPVIAVSNYKGPLRRDGLRPRVRPSGGAAAAANPRSGT